MSFRRISILLLLAGLIGLLRFYLGERATETGELASGGSDARIEKGGTPEAKGVSPNAKARQRQAEGKPDIDETLAALKATLPGLTEFPEQTLQERILAINTLLKKAGIALRFGVDEKLYPSNNLLEMTVPAFSQENATPNDILQHNHKALKKHYLLSDGVVLFQDASGG